MPGRLSLFPNEISKYDFPSDEVRDASGHHNPSRSSLSIVFESHASIGFGNQKKLLKGNDLIHEEQDDDEKNIQDWNSSYEEDTRSTSPSTSVNSSSEVGGDSGVSSEHDTPPLDSRKTMQPPTKPSAVDSDNDSSISSESFQEFRDALSSPHPHQEPPVLAYKIPDNKKNKRPYKRAISASSRLPDNLLREIKDKAQELKRKRQMLNGDSSRDRCSLSRANSYQRSGRLSRILPNTLSYLQHEFPTLSLADSSNYSSTTSLYTEDDDTISFCSEYMKPLYECPDEEASQGFAGLSDIFAPQQESTIRSSKGTVRGVKNRVRAGIAAFTSDQRFLKIYAEREKGKVVVYVTTLGIIRETFERCLRMRKILWTLLVGFEERDVFMSRDTQIQLLDRLHARSVSVPHIFLEGQYLGGVEFLERLNESGELRRLLNPYMRPATTTQCGSCTGFRLLPCPVCSGSKKSVHRNDFTLEFVALKCSSCDESGLVPCHACQSTGGPPTN